ncbi:DUF5804 family protein [Haladaptatus sp. DYSN1]|uniref:DUF5804 family protein n=1 Tax=unclassified Haladaptatus TaxID=2622732 RepID=UPI002406174F|nr:DUF5804 family protein [Haladaptatus sp. DYSN1]
MTQVCIVGSPEVDLRYELLSRDTAREALSTYRLHQPYANSIAVDTISLGAAVSLMNDLNWYLVRFASLTLVTEPSVAEDEWLSRKLAKAIREGDVSREQSAEFIHIYGVKDGELTEPLAVERDGNLPDYDLADVDETVVVRVTEAEF